MIKEYSSPDMEIRMFLPTEKLASNTLWKNEVNKVFESEKSLSEAEIGIPIPTEDWNN